MSTHSFKALLIREIEQAMQWVSDKPLPLERETAAREQGQLDAYAHVLQLIKEDL